MFILKPSAANGNVFNFSSLAITENSSILKLQYHLFVFGARARMYVCLFVPLARFNQLIDFHEICMRITLLAGTPNSHCKTIPYSL